MKKASNRLTEKGFTHRTEASIAIESHKYISHYGVDHNLKSFGESLHGVMMEAQTLGFVEHFSKENNNRVNLNDTAASKLQSIITGLTNKYKTSPDAYKALKELSACIHCPNPIDKDSTRFIDCYVGIETQDILELLSKNFKHQASKSIVIDSMIDFIKVRSTNYLSNTILG